MIRFDCSGSSLQKSWFPAQWRCWWGCRVASSPLIFQASSHLLFGALSNPYRSKHRVSTQDIIDARRNPRQRTKTHHSKTVYPMPSLHPQARPRNLPIWSRDAHHVWCTFNPTPSSGCQLRTWYKCPARVSSDGEGLGSKNEWRALLPWWWGSLHSYLEEHKWHWTPSAKILTLLLQCHFEDAVDHSDVIYTG